MASHVKAFSGRPTNPSPDHTQSCAHGRWLTHLRLLLHRQGTSSSIGVPPIPAALSQYAVTPHPSSARPASGTSTEPAVASLDHKGVFKALSASSVLGVLLLYHLRRPSSVPASPLLSTIDRNVLLSNCMKNVMNNIKTYTWPLLTRQRYLMQSTVTFFGTFCANLAALPLLLPCYNNSIPVCVLKLSWLDLSPPAFLLKWE